MTRILLVRMSSLGDILHTFPAATDIRRARPDAAIDWVVEEAYVPLVQLHPGVTRIIPIAFRRWRRRLFDPATWNEFSVWKRAVRESPYNAILDTQGLAKSLFVAKTARGPVHGFGPHTAREAWVARFYDRTYEFAPSDHKVERYRDVAANALHYKKPTEIDYGIASPPRPAFAPEGRYCVLLHATARASKQWPVEHWVELARTLGKGDLHLVPWGTPDEREQSQRIASGIVRARVPERRPLDEMARLIAGASFVVGVDTGLMHLAAALGVPLVAIFTDSEPGLTGPVGRGSIKVLGGKGSPPGVPDVIGAVQYVVS